MASARRHRNRISASLDTIRALAASARRHHELAVASGTVIGHRMALGVAAMIDPGGADHGEFTRMGTEKVAAFGAAGWTLAAEWQVMQQELAKAAANEFGAVTQTALALPLSLSPFSVQFGYLLDCFGRATTTAVTLTALAAGTRVLDPIHHRATANVRRLSRRKSA
jgi:hypothetical protein